MVGLGQAFMALTLALFVLNYGQGSTAEDNSLESRLDALENEVRLRKSEINGLRLENEYQENTIRSLRSELSTHELKMVAMAKKHQHDMRSSQKAFTKNLLSLKGMGHTGDQVRQKRMDPGNNVAFFAKVGGSDPLHLTSGDTIAFDNVVTDVDTTDHSYDGTSGVYTAPYDGRYVFSTTIKSEKHEGSAFGLFKNHQKMAKIWVHGGDLASSDTSSETVILDLMAGDEVSVKALVVQHVGLHPRQPHAPHPEDAIVSSGYTTFAGFLLSQHAQLSIVG